MNPVIGVLLSAVFLHEGGQAFSLKNLAALILVCAGVVIVNGKRRRHKASVCLESRVFPFKSCS